MACECGCGEATRPFQRTNMRKGEYKGSPRRFVEGHRNRLAMVTETQAEIRFWAKVDRTPDGCWYWCGKTLPNGYGVYRSGGAQVSAHRYAYQLSNGIIPIPLTIDHLCRIRHCVNPDHLEAVTLAENIRRGSGGTSGGKASGAKKRAMTVCRHGHPFDQHNTRFRENGTRACKACERERKKQTARNQREEAQADGAVKLHVMLPA